MFPFDRMILNLSGVNTINSVRLVATRLICILESVVVFAGSWPKSFFASLKKEKRRKKKSSAERNSDITKLAYVNHFHGNN